MTHLRIHGMYIDTYTFMYSGQGVSSQKTWFFISTTGKSLGLQ